MDTPNHITALLRPSPLTVIRRRLSRTIEDIAEPSNLTPRQIKFLEDHTLRFSRSTWAAIEDCLLPEDRLGTVSIRNWRAAMEIRFDAPSGPDWRDF